MSFLSIAKWPVGVGINLGNSENESTDTHRTREQAQNICDRLTREGFGGCGKIFPVATRVEEVKPATIKLDPVAVKAIFDAAQHQHEYLLPLYKLVVPEWDRIESCSAYPTCSPDTWSAICTMAQMVDRRINDKLPFDKQILPGGGWMNSGFSTRDDVGLALWEVLPIPADKIAFKTP